MKGLKYLLFTCFVLVAVLGVSLATSSTSDIFTPEQREQISQNEQKFEFQAEVNRMMDIIINSLYTNRDIFVREIISNAADALDKVRFLSLTDKSVLGEGDLAELDVHVKFDKDARTITFRDKGVGMTKDELVKNLGILARSGTTEFVEAAKQGKDALSLIGQFGVGFYSVYLVADKVTVTSKSPKSDEQYIWESMANSTFSVAPDPRGVTLGRGTEITLHLKADANEFLSVSKLRDLLKKYSQFINFPIYLEVTKKVTEEVEVEEPPVDVEATTEDTVVSEEEDAKEPKKTKKKITKDVTEQERVNSVKAIWTRSPSDIEDAEYEEFYKSLTKDNNNPLNKLHFSAEGDLAFKSLLYIPSKAEPGLYDRFYEKSTALKLFVRRVLITDEFKDFLPRYMNFVRGVVDSEDLPLNVNRETLAQNRVLKVMSKKLSRKVLEMVRKMAQEEKKAIEEEEDELKEAEERAASGEAEPEKTEEEKAEEQKKIEKREKAKKMYGTFWQEFGKSIKLGILDDQANKDQLVKLLRFKSSKSDGKSISFEDYLDRMPKTQKSIFYLSAESEEAIANSPFLEAAKRKDVEVLLMTDPLDEYVVQSVPDFDGTPLQSLTKENVSFGDEKKNLLKKQEKDLAGLTKWLKDILGSKIERVSVSQRLGGSPMVLTTTQYGWSATMEKIMKVQAFSDPSQAKYMSARKILEVNPYHPMIKELNTKVEQGNVETAKDQVMLLYDAALLQSGFMMDAPEDFATRVHRVVSAALNIPSDAELEPEPLEDLPEEVVEEAPVATDADTATETDGENVIKINPEDIKIDVNPTPTGDAKDEL